METSDGGLGGEQALLSGASSQDWEKGSLGSKSKHTGCRVAAGSHANKGVMGPSLLILFPSSLLSQEMEASGKGENVLCM